MQTKTGIIYLQKEKFQIYSPFLPNILEFRFVPELIHDYDLVNKELLENLLTVFIVNNKIPASGLLIVIADNASFIKDFVAPPVGQGAQPSTTPPPVLEDLQSMANQYIEHVPFEIVASKTFPLVNGVKAYATNQEIYEAIKSILEKHGFIIQGVIPGFAFGPQIGNLASIDGPTVGLILQKLSMVRAFNLLKDSGTIAEAPAVESTLGENEKNKEEEADEYKEPAQSTPPEGNKRVVIAIAISAIALIFVVTGVVLYSQFANPPYKPPPVADHPAAAAAVAPPAPTTVPTVQATGIVDAKDITVQIISASSSAVKAQAIQSAFIPHAFKSVTMQTQDALSTAQGLLIFSPRVSSDIRALVTGDVKKELGDVLVQDKADASFDIVVILGK